MPRRKALEEMEKPESEETVEAAGAEEDQMHAGEETVEAAGTEEDQEFPNEEEERTLIAILPILFESHQYKPGDDLPTHNFEMTDAWIKNHAAKWKEKGLKTEVRAKPAAAVAGMSGRAVPSGEEDLAGRMPGRR